MRVGVRVRRGVGSVPRSTAGCALLALVAVAGLLVARASPAAACSCAGTLTPRQQLAERDRIFVGRAVDVRSGGETPADNLWVTTFHVERVYKGRADGTARVLTDGGGSGTCGYDFRTGERYLVSANVGAISHLGRPGGDGLATNSCLQTSALATAGSDIARLERLVTPRIPRTGFPVPPPPALRDRLAPLIPISAVALLAGIAVLLVELRRRGAARVW